MEIVERHTDPILNSIGAGSASAQRDFFSGLAFDPDIYGLYPTDKPQYPTDNPTVVFIWLFEYGFRYDKIQVAINIFNIFSINTLSFRLLSLRAGQGLEVHSRSNKIKNYLRKVFLFL